MLKRESERFSSSYTWCKHDWYRFSNLRQCLHTFHLLIWTNVSQSWMLIKVRVILKIPWLKSSRYNVWLLPESVSCWFLNEDTLASAKHMVGKSFLLFLPCSWPQKLKLNLRFATSLGLVQTVPALIPVLAFFRGKKKHAHCISYECERCICYIFMCVCKCVCVTD